MTVTASADITAAQRKKEVRRVVLSSYLGSTIEFYDFLLYATAAAIVFAPVFFSDLSPLAGTIASMGTFAAGYLARPFGGVVFGHFGDRYGRKSMLLISMTVMGVASFLIGLVPPASAIGSWAAIILVLLRVCQGIAVGGEWGGAALMSLEHVGGRGRGFAASFTNAGAPTGSLLGTLALALVALLPEDDFLSWGWRIPFLLSAVMLAVGLFVRARVSESPLFREAMAKQAEVDATAVDRRTPPILSILRRPRNLLLVALGCMASFGIQTMFTTFAIGYASHSGVTRSQALLAFAVCQFVAIFTLLGFARLSDRVGRRPVMLFGLGAFVVLIVPILALLSSGNVALVTLGFVLGFGVCQSATYGPMAAYIAEQFGTAARYTGASLGYQGATLLGAGFTPVILASLQAAAGGGTGLVAAFMIGLAVLSAVFILLAKESKDRDLSTYEH
ncbi:MULTISPECIES: MFS transporter [Rhodococcus]|jgi:MFS family permease|uniref:MHS family MFS transporter n=1 Tax=Rhodococcus aetherivorans TaxID=191292 RepID=A0AA46PGU2_9NOCA|nr:MULTISPECIES: MFS transporter [Rhodococcus]AKE88352.1 MFS transporter [Rhodococcus aetherivorans]ANZ27018.1 MFS transporter [Rhodococcus sp. WB1]MBC2592079.1 MHS family MFS transporter [Rhodococcus aetherivorans]MDV6296119.1 MFS transporter [Rhodococcus aetherivorans]OLL20381.1 MFS transporter [Rhodococcus sp. M8]